MSDTLNRVPRIAENVTIRFLGDEAFVMNLNEVRTYSLNETAARVWALIDGSRTGGDIVRCITEEYDVPEETCRTAVLGILERLETENLIRFLDER